MLFLFKNFSRKYPKFSNQLQDLSLLAGLTATAVWATHSIDDPVKQEIAWKNFLDVESCRSEFDDFYEKRKTRP